MYADDDDYNDEIGDVLADRDGYPEPEPAGLSEREAILEHLDLVVMNAVDDLGVRSEIMEEMAEYLGLSEDECPAGGEHTWVDNAEEWIGVGPMPHPGIHCEECGVSGTWDTPRPERGES